MRNLSYAKYVRKPVYCNSLNNIKNACRNFHCNSNLRIKMFLERENKYAYDIMENKGYTVSLVSSTENVPISEEHFRILIQENWSNKTPNELFDCFPLLGVYCSQNGLCISNKMFDSFIDHLTDNIKLATDKQLEILFYSLCKWPETESIRTRNYIEVWAALDEECMNRMRQWNLDQLLSFIALFYMLNVTRVSDFSLKSLRKLATKSKQLTTSQLVQTMFFIGVVRKPPFDMHFLEVHFDNMFSECSVDDLAIISMGFFKSKTPLRSMELVSKIIDVIIENPKDIHEVSLAALLKIIRYSMKIVQNNKIYELLEVLQYEIPRLSLMCNVHIALLGTSMLTLHKQCLNKIAEKVIETMSEARLKDLERLVLTFGTFGFRPETKECFFQKVIEELKRSERTEEIKKHSRSYACCISFLGILGIYPLDLMNKVLDPSFLRDTYGKYCILYGKEVLNIHNAVEIFYPNTEMNRLDDKNCSILSKKYTDYVPSEDYSKQYNITERMFLDVVSILKESRGGADFVIGEHILTHHQRGDIVICNDSNGSPLPVVDVFKQRKFGLIVRPPDNNDWIVLVIAGRNGLIHNLNTPSGPFLNKIRELKALGYYAGLVLWSKYASLETNEEKLIYINDVIKEAVNNKYSK
ncbi:FAST kinase domain-containing protein 5, mitochondrial [Aphomia sociella]